MNDDDPAVEMIATMLVAALLAAWAGAATEIVEWFRVRFLG